MDINNKLMDLCNILSEPSKVSIIFLLCKDSQSGLQAIQDMKSNQTKFTEFLMLRSAESGPGFVSSLKRALLLTQNLKALRGMQGNEGRDVDTTELSPTVRSQLYTIAESLTSQQTAQLVESITGCEYDTSKLLEEILMEWDTQGVLSINTDSVPANLCNAAYSLLPDLKVNAVTATVDQEINNESEFYQVIDNKNVGLCVIINQETFTRNTALQNLLPDEILQPRRGSERDVEVLRKVFTWLGFRVRHHSNVTLSKLRTLLIEYASSVQINHSFFCLIMMSHGTEDVVYTSDSIPVKVEALELAFQRNRCQQLVGKPKILIIQACQGSQSQRIEVDDVNSNADVGSSFHGPERGDAFIAWSTVKGYASFRDRFEGSWFIQELCDELMKNAHKRDLVDMVTRVNNALRMKTNNGYFMVPALMSSLCKRVKFPVTEPFKDVPFNGNK